MSKIEWTDESLNCITGCTPCSAGCQSCYARVMTKRLKGMGMKKYAAGFGKVVLYPEAWQVVSKWKKSRKVFLNSMSDTFHEDVPWWFIKWLFENMNLYDNHIWQILTKRSRRMEELCSNGILNLKLTPNIWLGVTVENVHYKYRIEHLRQTKAKVKFLSCEPLLGSLGVLDLTGISMVIVGCETGPGARYMNPEWAREIRDQCREQDTKFFMKKISNKEPIPDDLMIREFPDYEN